MKTKLCELFDVEIGEKFKISCHEDDVFYVGEDEAIHKNVGSYATAGEILYAINNGIIKLHEDAEIKFTEYEKYVLRLLYAAGYTNLQYDTTGINCRNLHGDTEHVPCCLLPSLKEGDDVDLNDVKMF